MGRIVEKQRWKCRSCGSISFEPALLVARSPFEYSTMLTACPVCKQCDEGFDVLCDEPGCNRIAGCGWPTENNDDEWGGYRNTCYAHMKDKK
jgi:hypothetical protein